MLYTEQKYVIVESGVEHHKPKPKTNPSIRKYLRQQT